MIVVRNLEVSFSTHNGLVHAVRSMDFSLQKGEIVAIVGESGSGKSVTAQSILGLVPKEAIRNGEILINGENIYAITNEKRRSIRGNVCSMIFQEPARSFDPLFTIGKSFRELIRAHNPDRDADEIEQSSIAILKEVGIQNPEQRLANYPHQFSGGQLQRIMIALAMLSNPEYIIADEPTTALDVTVQKKILDLLFYLKEEKGVGILFITHDLSLAKNFADRVLVMYGGMLFEEGDAKEVFTSPQHPYTKALIASVPEAGTHYTQSPLVAIEGTVPNPRVIISSCPFEPRCPLRETQCKEGLPKIVKNNTRIVRCVRAYSNGVVNA